MYKEIFVDEVGLKGLPIDLPYFLVGAPPSWDSARVKEWKPTRKRSGGESIPFAVRYSLGGLPQISIVGWFNPTIRLR